ncbi:MAG: peptide chain release factor N(5)-glutamine methyltransferase [Vicinamibacterales bacterium]
MRARDLAAAAEQAFVAAGIPAAEARLDAELLLRHVLGWDRATWVARRDDDLPPDLEARSAPLVARRTAREPVAYIRGVQAFYGRDFAVGPGVLVPRPETELLIEEGLAAIAALTAPRVLDVGTGSGCLAVTLALERPDAEVAATDISAAALAWAQRNAEAHGVGARIAWAEAEGTGPFAGPFDLVIANPPYVAEGDRPRLQPEVVGHEPATALFAGPDGLDAIRPLAPAARAVLRPGGTLAMEIGAGQADEVVRVVRAAGFADARVRDDLQGIPRVVVARR